MTDQYAILVIDASADFADTRVSGELDFRSFREILSLLERPDRERGIMFGEDV